MKLVRYGRAGAEKPGLIDDEGAVRDLSRVVKDITPEVIAAAGLKRLRGVNVKRLPVVRGRLRLGCPLAGIGKMVCIGLNYKSHAVDIEAVQPEEPGSFMKPASCMFEPGGEIELPPPDLSNDVDAEGELGVVIGKSCRYVPLGDVPQVIFGYTTTLDLTALEDLCE